MDLKSARSEIMTNLTSEFTKKYNITEPLVDLKIDHYYTIIASETKSLENNFTKLSVADQQSYSLSDKFLLIKRVLYDYQASTQWGTDLQEVNPDHFMNNEDLSTLETGDPTYYWLEQPHRLGYGKIYIYPAPAVNDKIIRVFAYTLPDVLSSDSSIFEFKKYLDLALIQGVTKEVGAIGEGIPNLGYFERNYLYNLEKAKELLSETSANRVRKVAYKESWQ